MQAFSIILLALNAANMAFAAPVAEAEAMPDIVSLEARQTQVAAYAWKDANYVGARFDITTRSACLDVPASFNDAISSIALAKGVTCVIYADINCKGDYRVFANNGNGTPASNNLASQNFNDRMSSYICA